MILWSYGHILPYMDSVYPDLSQPKDSSQQSRELLREVSAVDNVYREAAKPSKRHASDRPKRFELAGRYHMLQ